jgi:hypothetical protein
MWCLMLVDPQAHLQRLLSRVENLQRRWFLHADLINKQIQTKFQLNSSIQVLLLGFFIFLR